MKPPYPSRSFFHRQPPIHWFMFGLVVIAAIVIGVDVSSSLQHVLHKISAAVR